MKDKLKEIYEGIIGGDNTRETVLKCMICEKKLKGDEKGSMQHEDEIIDHFNNEHNRLSRKIWDFDYSLETVNESFYRIMFGDRRNKKGGYHCRLCDKYGIEERDEEREGIVQHYLRNHSFLIRFFHEGNLNIPHSIVV